MLIQYRVIDQIEVPYAGILLQTSAITNGFELFSPGCIFLLDLARNGKSPKTISTYAYHLAKFISVIQSSSGNNDWKKINHHEANAYLNSYLSINQRLSNNTVCQHTSTLIQFYDWAYENGFLEKKIDLKWQLFNDNKKNNYNSQPKKKIEFNLEKQYISQNEFDLLLSYEKKQDPFIRERNELILQIGYALGLRSSEVTNPNNLKISELELLFSKSPNPLGFPLKINGKGNKTRTVIVSQHLCKKILQFLNGRRKQYPGNNLICSIKGQTLNRQFASNVFSSYASNLDSEWKYRSFHSLRHSFATNLVIECISYQLDYHQIVPEQLGHSHLDTSLNNYVNYAKVLMLYSNHLSKVYDHE